MDLLNTWSLILHIKLKYLKFFYNPNPTQKYESVVPNSDLLLLQFLTIWQ